MTKSAGRYEITTKLGEGETSVVYRALAPHLKEQEVAIKILHETVDPAALDLFYKECNAVKSISHPNIVEIIDLGEYEDGGDRRPFIVMPLLNGQTFDDLIRKSGHRLTVDRVIEIVAQTCRGLQAAHDHGLIHRDLRPSNIFVMDDDSVKVIDFGVAHAVHAATQTAGYDKGTLPYMAPELVQDKPVSVQSDIYSLGVTVYEALTRRQPFRRPTEPAVVEAILRYIPPPASELNPSVNQLISRAVHKAFAKQPWNRYNTAKEFSDTLQKALRNEPIAAFDTAHIQPRIQTASRAVEKGDVQFAGEIVSELEAEGNSDPGITLLRAQIDQIARQKTITHLLESARAREEEEEPLALQQLHELLQLDPGNVAAHGLKARIESRRNERQIEQWLRLARQHLENQSHAHAREALRNALVLRPDDRRALRLLEEIEVKEREHARLRQQKAEMYQAAVNAWKNGEISQALNLMERVLEIDRLAPDSSSADAAGMYQSFFDRIRSDHDALNNGYAQARRHLADKRFTEALQICHDFLDRYPRQALFQALKLDVEEHQRQQLSSFIAETDRRLDAEQDLGTQVSFLREAVHQYPQEEHFARLLKLANNKRDLVNSIVERARMHEERGQISEALADLNVLQTIYGAYPGLKFEKERLEKRLEQHTRDIARGRWVAQVDQLLGTANWQNAIDLVDKALVEFPEDRELLEMRRTAQQGLERSGRAERLMHEGQRLCARGEFDRGVELLKDALQLDDRPTARLTLRDVFVLQAQAALDRDWREVEAFADRALELDPSHALARSLRAQALEWKRQEVVEQYVSRARRLQAHGDLDRALAEVNEALAAHQGDTRLTTIHQSLTNELARERTRLVAARDTAEPESQPIARQARVPVPARASEQAQPLSRVVTGILAFPMFVASGVIALAAIVTETLGTIGTRSRHRQMPPRHELPPSNEPVLVAVSAPRQAQPGTSFTARFVAYVKTREKSVRNRLRRLDEAVGRGNVQAVLGLSPDRGGRWVIGTPVTVRLTSAQFQVDRDVQSFEWNGTENLLSFVVSVPDTAVYGTTQLCFEAFIEGVPVAFVPLNVVIGSEVPAGEPVTVTERPMSSGFASYASKDGPTVALLLSALKRWDPQADVFMDCLDLTPNENWQRELERVIPSKDAFLLFWSTNASKSPWVAWELQLARSTKGVDWIRPMPIDDPQTAPPPEFLRHLQFGDKYLLAREALLRREERRPT